VRALLAIQLLSGCVPYWVKSAGPVQCSGPIYHASAESLRQACSYHAQRTLHACVVMYAAPGIGIIHMGPEADECDLRHEKSHCDGWQHDERMAYTKDCGPKEAM